MLLYLSLSAPAAVIEFWLEQIGRPKYGSGPGELKKSGEDLDAKGLTEYLWDVLYWTWGCVLGAGVLGDWVWWFWVSFLQEIRALADWMADCHPALHSLVGVHDLYWCASRNERVCWV